MTDTLSALRARLVSGLTDIDRKESEREALAGRRVNVFRLGILLHAASDCLDAIDRGEEPSVAYAEHFTPTRDNHRLAVKLGFAIDVRRGQWCLIAP